MTNALLSNDPALAGFVPEWSKPAAPTPQDYQAYSAEQARRYGIDPEVERRKIQQESGFRPYGDDGKPLTSSAGALGIAQFMPGTAADEGIDPTDPWAALEASARHSSKLLKMFGGDQRAATAAYNAGAGNIGTLTKKYGADWEQHLEEQLGDKGAAETRLYLSTIHGDGYHGAITPPGVDQSVHPSGDVVGSTVGAMLSRPEEGNGISITPWDLPQQQEDQATLSAGDVPYAAGQEDPAVLNANLHSRQMQALDQFDNAPSVFSQAKDAATSDLPFKDTIRDVTQRASQALTPLGELDAARLGVNKATGLDLPQPSDVYAGIAAPQTFLDAAMSVPGEAVRPALGVAGKVLKGADEAGGVARIIPKTKGQLNKAMAETLRIAEEARQAVLKRGGTVQEARQAAAQAMREAQSAAGAADNVTLAVDRAVESQKYTNTGKRLRATAKELESRMGPGVVGEGAADAAKAPDALSNEADVLDWALKDRAQEGSTIGDVATAAKRLGDPASEIRRQLQQGGGEPDTVNAATNKRGDTFTDAAAQERRAQQQAAQRAIEEHQARVEAADLARNKEKWLSDTAKEAAKNEARSYHEGGFGKDVAAIFGLPRALSLSSDAGTLRDLGLFVGSKEGRQAFVRGARDGLSTLIHSDADARQLVKDAEQGSRWFGLASDEKVLERPFHSYQFGEGVSAADRVPELSSLNDSAISRTVEKLHPGIRLSDRVMATQRNVAGIDLLESRLNEIAVKYGVTSTEEALKNPRFLSEMQSTVDTVNHLRGYSGGGKAKGLSVLNALTSPQQMISRLQVIGDPLNFAVRGDMESAKFAAKNLLGFATSQAALMGLAHLTGGAGRWSVNLNPTSGDFGTVRIGNTRYDTMAGLGPTFRLVSKIGAEVSDQVFETDYAKNQAEVGLLVQRWLENKEQPTSRIVTDFMLHNKIPDEQTAINMLAPSIATGFMQNLAEERGVNKALAVPNAALNFAGVGTNTYKTGFDQADEVAQQLTGQKFNDIKDPLARLPIIAQLPDEATQGMDNPKKAERQKFNEALNKAGYLEAPQDRTETDSEKKKRLTANADVINTHPDLDVQRWYWEGQDSAEGKAGSGTVHSIEAANKAANLGVPNRPVHYGGADRNFAASDDDRKALKEKGNLLDQYINVDPELVDAFVKEPKYKAMKPDEARKAATSDVRDQIRAIPQVDAALAFFGYGGDDKEYKLHSTAALPELQKLWDAYPKAAKFAKEGMGVGFVKGAK